MASAPNRTTATLLNMIVCDGAHRDTASGKWTLLGVFNSVSASGFPITHPQFIVYIALRATSGKTLLRVQIVATDKADEMLYKIEAELVVQDPQAVTDVVVPIRNLTFTRPGEYLLQVFADNEFLGERSIVLNSPIGR